MTGRARLGPGAATKNSGGMRPKGVPRGERRGVVPPHVLVAVAERAGDPGTREWARRALGLDAGFRRRRIARTAQGTATPRESATGGRREIRDCANTEVLPGDVVRVEGDPPTGDAAADEAYEGLGTTRALLRDAFGRDSVDGEGAPLQASVHYSREYPNAFYDGERVVFGDGDGELFRRFTLAVDVIAHEVAHGVVADEAGLVYRDQAGALNESVCDVLGSLAKQYRAGESAGEADWLVGEGLFAEGVEGRALRSMAEPGTAYDDGTLGRDPQPAHMDDYVETEEDDGGVHINSGIPNRAFYLAATALRGPAWEAAGRIWYGTLTDDGLSPEADFAAFSALTARVASRLFGEGSAEHDAVRGGWAGVGLPVD